MKKQKLFLIWMAVLLLAVLLASFWELVVQHWLNPAMTAENHRQHLTILLTVVTLSAMATFILLRIAFRALTSERKIGQAFVESEERNRNLIEKSPSGILIHTEGIIRFANPKAAELFGAKSPDKLIGMKVHDFIHPDYRDIAVERMKRLWQGATAMPLIEMTMLHFDGEPFDAEVFAGQATFDGKPALQSVFSDISDRKKRERVLAKIAQGLSGSTGKRYLQNLALFLSDTFKVDHVMIGRLTPEKDKLEMQAICSRGKVKPAVTYALVNTPCEQVLNSQIRVYEKNIQAQFPKDDRLVEMGIESYIGIPLIATTGRVIGVIVLMDGKPMQEDTLTNDLLKIFSVQVVAEFERMEAEAELGKLIRAVEQSLSVVIIANTDGIIEYVNKAYLQLSGYSLLGVLGKPQHILKPGWHPDENGIDVITRLQQGKEWRGSFIERIKGGRTLWAEATINPIIKHDGTISHFVTTANDITESKLADEALSQSRKMLRAVIDATPAMIHAKSSNGAYVFVNQYMAERFGFDPADAVGKRTEDLYPVETAHILEALDKRVLLSGESLQNLEREMPGPDGTLQTWLISKAPRFDDQGKVSDIVTIALDITDRKKAEALKDRLLAIIEATPDLVGIVDRLGRFVYINKAGRRMVGLSDIETIDGREITTLHPPEFAELILHTGLPKAAQQGIWAGETVFLNTRGEEIPTSQVILAHKNEDDDIDYFSTIARDITDRIRSEKDLIIAKNTAEAANRSKSEFLTNVTHELRTPLNSIIGFSDILLKETSGPLGNPDYKDYANDINESGKHLLDLINDILDVSRIESNQMELVEKNIDVPQMIKSCQRMISERAQTAGLNLIVDCPDHLPALKGDERRLKQVLLNLLTNAIKFTSRGGTITLTAELNDKNAFLLSVQDTGIGIRESDFDIIMQPFGQIDSSLRRNQDGVGLGLPLSNSLVLLHGGHIDLESAPHSGSTFTVIMPPERTIHLKDCKPASIS